MQKSATPAEIRDERSVMVDVMAQSIFATPLYVHYGKLIAGSAGNWTGRQPR
jgi:hypothetical protein